MESKILVALQFLIISLFVYRGTFLKVDPFSLTLNIIALAIGAWALWEMRQHLNVFPELREDAQLLQTGPYAFVRNPMYLSLLILLLPALYPSWDTILMLGYVTMAICLFMKSKIEEKELTERFTAYSDYRRSVKSIIPWVL